MRIVIRADASVTIGSGHVVRCLTLAAQLAEGGDTVAFVCRQLPEALEQRIAAAGHRLHRLAPPAVEPGDRNAHGDWLGVPWQDDARDTAAAVAALGGADWLVADHYALDEQWESRLRSHAARIMVIDDLADRYHDCDLLVDHNVAAEPMGRYEGLLPPHALCLAGPRFALLRPEWAGLRAGLALMDDAAGHGPRRVLVSYGGTDPTGETAKAIEALARLSFPVAADVVIGTANPQRRRIEALVAQHDFATLTMDTPRLAELAAAADLALGAAGGSALERCCVGLPSVLTVCGANQAPGSAALAAAGAALNLGDADTVTVERLHAVLEGLNACPDLLAHMSQQALAQCDGQGARRVVQRMRALSLRLRPATADDCDPMWHWRNHPDNRRHARNPGPIALDRHRQWFAATLADPCRLLLVAEDDAGPAGVLRFDLDLDTAQAATAEVSIYLVPERHGQGLGSVLLGLGEAWLAQHHPAVHAIEAEVHEANAASMAIFFEAGYEPARQILVKRLAPRKGS